MAKHTPGPWEAVYSTVYGADGFEVVDADQGPHLRRDFDSETEGHWGTAPNSHVERDEDETDANARLIAAAPEMLEALDDMVMICGRTGNALDDFEEQAERFHRETGVMRPGKDIAAAFGCELDRETRRARYNEWIEEKIANARAAVAKAGG